MGVVTSPSPPSQAVSARGKRSAARLTSRSSESHLFMENTSLSCKEFFSLYHTPAVLSRFSHGNVKDVRGTPLVSCFETILGKMPKMSSLCPCDFHEYFYEKISKISCKFKENVLSYRSICVALSHTLSDEARLEHKFMLRGGQTHA